MSIFEYDEEKMKQAERDEGRNEGRIEGKIEGIFALIIDNINEGKSDRIIKEKLLKLFNLSKEEAEEYLNCVKENEGIK